VRSGLTTFAQPLSTTPTSGPTIPAAARRTDAPVPLPFTGASSMPAQRAGVAPSP